MRLQFISGLTVETKVYKHTKISELREGLLRISGGSMYWDEAVLVEEAGKLHEEPWAKPFDKEAGVENAYIVIVRPFGKPTTGTTWIAARSRARELRRSLPRAFSHDSGDHATIAGLPDDVRSR